MLINVDNVNIILIGPGFYTICTEPLISKNDEVDPT